MRPALGTAVVIEARAPDEATAARAIEAAFAQVAHVEAVMHPYDADSDVARLNAAAPGSPVALRPATHAVLSFAQQLHRASGGAFDPCLPLRPGTLVDLDLTDRPQPAARVRRPVALDLGGIAKGYAVDQAVAVLRSGGCSAGLVNAGGDLRVFGTQPQTVLLRGGDGALAALELTEAALAVSHRSQAGAPTGHRGYYRRDGAAVSGTPHAAVEAGSAMCADALTKLVLVCQEEVYGVLLREHGALRRA
ncbi:MAG: FAD:protein FMN transferase [Proteobacteria bacterium]|nr:FAD:protein FMN transferase [Pseudomonadota bacterium]